MNDFQLSEELSRNFHLFWDNFPFPVLLAHKDRTILDRNKANHPYPAVQELSAKLSLRRRVGGWELPQGRYAGLRYDFS